MPLARGLDTYGRLVTFYWIFLMTISYYIVNNMETSRR